MRFPILAFARYPADVAAEDVEHGSAELFCITRQVEEFVGTAQAHGVRLMPQVLNGIFQAFLPLPLLGVPVGFCLLLHAYGTSRLAG